MSIYAFVGETSQHICKDRFAPQGSLLMVESNPGGYLCHDNGDGTGSWVNNPETLKKEASDRMSETLSKGFEFNGIIYQCEEKDMVQWTRGKMLMDEQVRQREVLRATLTPEEFEALSPITTTARAMDNSNHTLSSEDFTALVLKAGITYLTALELYWEEVDSIV